jgi:hypothetical protein
MAKGLMAAHRLVDLKRPKQSTKKRDYPVVETSGERYGYGIRVRLEKPELAKLKVNVNDYNIGDTVSIVAKAKIINLSESESMDSDDQKSVEMQITKMRVI